MFSDDKTVVMPQGDRFPVRNVWKFVLMVIEEMKFDWVIK
jgi:hypothetical protein